MMDYWDEAKRMLDVLSAKERLREKSIEEKRFFALLKEEDDLLKIDDVAKILRTTAAGIRTKLCRNPESVPQPFRLPKSKTLFWQRKDVDEFIKMAKEQKRKPVFDLDEILKNKRKRKTG